MPERVYVKPAIFDVRAADAARRLETVRSVLHHRLSDLPVSDKHPSLSIYATGSLARGEATIHSDLDAFFMLSSMEEEKPIGRIRDTRIFYAVLKAQEAANFPDFSNEGEYLKFLHIEDVIRNIGGRSDDYKNGLTARMLLMLESQWLYDERRFEEFRKQIVQAYFEDYHDHSADFKPIFLLNDILRFWRTLCLNYENSRSWREAEDEPDKLYRPKGHLKNLKLKFSRMNICFSFICHLLSQGGSLSAENAIATASLTPVERLVEIANTNPEFSGNIKTMLELYAWFLTVTDKQKDECLSWISEEANRIDAFKRAAEFVVETGNLVRGISEKNGYIRYLLV